MIFPVITIRQPWAALIASGHKDIENRDWRLPDKFRNCTVLIHSSAKPAFDPHAAQLEMVARGWPMEILHSTTLCGCIVGAVQFTACLASSTDSTPSAWADQGSKFWWVVGKAILLPPVPAIGKLKFWQFDYPHRVSLAQEESNAGS